MKKNKKSIFTYLIILFLISSSKNLEAVRIRLNLKKSFKRAGKNLIRKNINLYRSQLSVVAEELIFQERTKQEKLLKYVAYHEAGHALVAHKLGLKVTGIYAHTKKLSGETKIEFKPKEEASVSIKLPKEWTPPESLSALEQEELYKKYITVFFAGGIVTSKMFDSKYGCIPDQTFANAISRDISDDKLPISKKFNRATKNLTYRQKGFIEYLTRYITPFTLNEIYKKIKNQPILNECYKDSEKIINENMETLHKLAKAIQESDTKHSHIKNSVPNGSWKYLDGEEIEKIIDGC